MDNLILHIEYLLLHNDCVIVPGLGAFIRMKFPASIDYESGRIIPMWSEVRFNQSVIHDDGMLTASFARKYRISFAEAREMAGIAIADLKTLLRQDGEVSLGRLGILRMGEEKNISFHPIQSASELNAQLGLRTVEIIHSPNTEENVEEQESVGIESPAYSDNCYHIAIPKTMAKIAASLLLVMFTALVLLIPTDTSEHLEQRASMMPLSPSELSTGTPKASSAEESRSLDDISDNSTVEETETTPTAVDEELYYLIVATFTSEDDADRYISSYSSTAYTLSKVNSGKMCRVSAKSADNSSELYRLLNSSEFQNHFKEAWVWHK